MTKSPPRLGLVVPLTSVSGVMCMQHFLFLPGRETVSTQHPKARVMDRPVEEPWFLRERGKGTHELCTPTAHWPCAPRTGLVSLCVTNVTSCCPLRQLVLSLSHKGGN